MENNYGYTGNNYEYHDHIPDVPESRSKKPVPFWKKALATVALGLLFGAFTGAGIYISGLLTGAGNSSKAVAEESAPEPAKAPETKAQETAPAPVISLSSNIVDEKGVVAIAPADTGSVTVTGALDVSDVVEKVMPAVVSITNNYIETAQDIFGQKYEAQSKAAGSGIIVGDNGDELLIVTNQHVVDDADSLLIQFIDGSEAEADLKGEDESADLAVIAVNKSKLSSETQGKIKIASLGDSEDLKVGQTAIAIGNAMGYGQSVTTGVVSAVDRDFTLSNGTHKMIQTDAAINPGNSGGALLDINGNVIGINEAKLSNSMIEGMGYAIPISGAKEIIDSLMNQSTKVKVEDSEKGYLGISGVDVTSEISEQYNMPRGVYIAKIGSGLAADNAGMSIKSIITSFDGQSVQTMEQLQSLMQYYKIGDTVKVVVQQPVEDGYGYEEKTYDVVLGGSMSMTSNGDGSVEEDQQEEVPEQEEQQQPGNGWRYYGLDDFFNNFW